MIDEKYTWNLTDIFKTENEREECKNSLLEKVEEIKNCKGKLKESADNIYNCYMLYEKISELFEKYYCYALFLYNKDMSKTDSIKIFKEAEKIQSEIVVATAFITPELTNIDENKLKQYVNDEKLKRYKRVLQEILDEKKHILSEKEENILAMYGEVLGASENTYEMLAEVEMKFPKVTDDEGKDVTLTQGMYGRLVMSQNRDVRKQAYYGMYETYKDYINTFTETYITNVKTDVITSKIRNYKSSLEKAVLKDDSTMKAYEFLVKSVNDNLNVNHEFMRLKKELLKLDEMHLYDTYVNSLEDTRNDIEFEKGRKLVLEALKPLGEEYNKMLEKAFAGRWLDVYETENKRSGGYSCRSIWSSPIYIIKL